MKRILLITILSLSCIATFATKSNVVNNKLKKEKQAKMLSVLNLSYTTSCGISVDFSISSENLSKVGIAIDYLNDKYCGTHWLLDDTMFCPCP